MGFGLGPWAAPLLMRRTGATQRLKRIVRAAGGVLIDAASSELYIERSSPTTVAAVGDPVGTIVDPVSGLTFVPPTDAARAVLRREPVGGVRNLLARTEEFDNAYWDKANATVSQVDGPAWSLTAEAGTDIVPAIRRSGDVGPVDTWRIGSVEIRPQGHSRFVCAFNSTLNNNNAAGGATVVELTGAGSVVATVANDAQVEPLEGGWYRVTILRNGTGFGTPRRFAVSIARPDATSPDDVAWSPTGGEGGEIRFPQYESVEDDATLSARTPYQRVGNANDITEAGVPSVLYLRGDGIDDGYRSTADFNPGATDKLFALCAVRKRSDDATGVLVETAANSGNADGSFIFVHSWSAGDAQQRTWQSGTRGSNPRNRRTGRIYPAPDLAVIDAAFDHSAATTAAQNVFLRNGAEMDGYDNAGPTGAGNFQPHRLNLLARNNADRLFAAADCHLLAILPGATTEATRDAIRRIAAHRIGVTLP